MSTTATDKHLCVCSFSSKSTRKYDRAKHNLQSSTGWLQTQSRPDVRAPCSRRLRRVTIVTSSSRRNRTRAGKYGAWHITNFIKLRLQKRRYIDAEFDTGCWGDRLRWDSVVQLIRRHYWRHRRHHRPLSSLSSLFYVYSSQMMSLKQVTSVYQITAVVRPLTNSACT